MPVRWSAGRVLPEPVCLLVCPLISPALCLDTTDSFEEIKNTPSQTAVKPFLIDYVCVLVGMSRGMWRRYNRRRTDRCDVRASPIGPHGRWEEVGSAWPSSQPGLCPQQLARRASDREKVTVEMWKTRKQTEKRFWKARFTKLGNNCTQFGKLVTKKLYMHLHLLRKVHKWLGLILKTDLFAGHFVPWMWGNSEMYLDKIIGNG